MLLCSELNSDTITILSNRLKVDITIYGEKLPVLDKIKKVNIDDLLDPQLIKLIKLRGSVPTIESKISCVLNDISYKFVNKFKFHFAKIRELAKLYILIKENEELKNKITKLNDSIGKIKTDNFEEKDKNEYETVKDFFKNMDNNDQGKLEYEFIYKLIHITPDSYHTKYHLDDFLQECVNFSEIFNDINLIYIKIKENLPYLHDKMQLLEVYISDFHFNIDSYCGYVTDQEYARFKNM